MHYIAIIGMIALWGGIAFSIYNNWVKQSAELPKGTSKQKFSTLMKTIVPMGVATLVLTTVIALMLPDAAYDSGSVILSVLGWVAFIGYTVFMYNKIYLQDKNSNRTDDPTTLTKVETSTAKPKQEEKIKETLTWNEPPKVEEKKVEPIKTEVTITDEEEEKIYVDVAKELKENRREGLWTKGFAECDGDEKKTELYYIKNRVKALMEELKESKKKN